jgi:hypothetical protein
MRQKQGNSSLLNLSLALQGYDRFRIEFDSADMELVYQIQVFDGDGDNTILCSVTTFCLTGSSSLNELTFRPTATSAARGQ